MGTGKGAAGGYENLISVVGFLCREGLALPAAMTRGKRLTETFRLVAM